MLHGRAKPRACAPDIRQRARAPASVNQPHTRPSRHWLRHKQPGRRCQAAQRLTRITLCQPGRRMVCRLWCTAKGRPWARASCVDRAGAAMARVRQRLSHLHRPTRASQGLRVLMQCTGCVCVVPSSELCDVQHTQTLFMRVPRHTLRACVQQHVKLMRSSSHHGCYLGCGADVTACKHDLREAACVSIGRRRRRHLCSTPRAAEQPLLLGGTRPRRPQPAPRRAHGTQYASGTCDQRHAVVACVRVAERNGNRAHFHAHKHTCATNCVCSAMRRAC